MSGAQYDFHVGITRDVDDRFINLKDLVNFNMGVFGQSGSGKTYTLRRIIQALHRANVTTVVIDTQGDMKYGAHYDAVGPGDFAHFQFAYHGANTCLSPLEIDTLSDSGGYYPAIQRAIKAVEYFHPALGYRQRGVLESMLEETYTRFGILRDKPETWTREPPALSDVVDTIDLKLKELYTGLSEDILTKCFKLRREVAALSGKIDLMDEVIGSEDAAGRQEAELEMTGAQYDALKNRLEDKIAALSNEAGKYVEAEARRGVGNAPSGKTREWLELVRMTIKDMLNTSLFTGANGFHPIEGKINVVDIRGLSDNHQQTVVYLLLGQVFKDGIATCRQLNAGVPRLVAVLDEAKIYKAVCEDSMSPFPRIVTEGRKFGLGALLGAQTSSQVSKEILSNIAVQFVLSMPSNELPAVKRVFGINEKQMTALIPKSDGCLSVNSSEYEHVHLWQWDPPR